MKVLLYKPIQNDYNNNTLEVCIHLNWIEMGCGCKCKKNYCHDYEINSFKCKWYIT